MKNIKISLASLLLVPFFSMASMTVVKNDTVNNVDIDVAKILYVGGVDEAKVVELISAIDEINIKYKNTRKIFLYINSSGGDMDSGYMAYEAVRNSTIPIVTVNASMTGSSATMMYCGAKERLMMSGAYFYCIRRPLPIKALTT
ncbi:ATP-dependent Clp protease proteolytic subunit [Budvicia aquatica]|uniref:ATP-dependent Clp protease proteolytic subunit n=2 Tax=Budvicia aquatica TaxID=82979 RepID=A0A484ZVZ2_9GAMM|nr:ATP-dependent Clp protease proteolytic subunit [Budvicia aquatica]